MTLSPSRIKSVRARLQELNLDSLFITSQTNVSYLTHFTGLAPSEREGFFFITQRSAKLLTFPTYFGLYKDGGMEFDTLNITREKRLSDYLSDIIKKEKVKKIGFEKENLTVFELESLKNKFQPKADRPRAEKISFVGTTGIVEKLRIIKDDEELENIKKAAGVTDRAFEYIKSKIQKGIAEKELALELEYFIKKHADDVAFAPIVAFNENAAIPHYIPTNSQQLTTNNLVLLDFGAKVGGYCADMTRVIFFGTPKNNWGRIYETVLTAQQKALESLKVDIAAGIPDKLAREYIKSQGFPDYPHGLGHGVGLAIHEAPRLRFDSKEILAENMVVTVEPGIYLPGEGGVRIEDLVVLKKNGIEILSKSSKELLIVGSE